jgi:hypothetical protein
MCFYNALAYSDLELRRLCGHCGVLAATLMYTIFISCTEPVSDLALVVRTAFYNGILYGVGICVFVASS